MKSWFSFDEQEGEFNFFETEEEARKDAEDALDYYRDNAGSDGWPENEQCVGYGKLSALPVRCDIETREEWEKEHDPEDDPWPYPDFDEVYDLQLAPVPPEAT